MQSAQALSTDIEKERCKRTGNRLQVRFLSRAGNVAMARLLAAAVAAEREITVSELDEIKVAISEAVSNAMIHGYEGREDGWVELDLSLTDRGLIAVVRDEGIGIADIASAMRPGVSSGDGRMGLGFVFMQSFMDSVDVVSHPGQGTKVTLFKNLS